MRQSRPTPVVRPMSVQRPLRLVRELRDDQLPPSPAIQHGVTFRYMGTERKRIEGENTGYVYYADPERRLVEIDRRDLAMFLSLRAFVPAD